MRFNIISSGSKGNATIIQEKDTVILIDMGISLSRLEDGLKEFHLSMNDIDAAFFTHDHIDHIRGLKYISPGIQYALKGTLPTSLSHQIELYEEVKIKNLIIIPVPTSHDATNPCGYLVKSKSETLLYITDTGMMLEETINFTKNPSYIIIESNHDIKMLMNTNRTYELKNRIMSNYGHLCNEDSAIAVTEIIGPCTKEIYLAHLSEEANTPEVAIKAYQKIFLHFGVNIDQYKLVCSHQHHSTIGGHYED